MTEYGTIKLPREQYEQHNECRQDMGLTWAGYIDGQAPEVSNGAEVDVNVIAEELKNQLSMANDPTVDLDVGELYDRIDTLESAVKEATQAAQSAERKVEELEESVR